MIYISREKISLPVPSFFKGRASFSDMSRSYKPEVWLYSNILPLSPRTPCKRQNRATLSHTICLAAMEAAIDQLFSKKPDPYIRHPFASKDGRQGWNEVGWGRGRGRGRARKDRGPRRTDEVQGDVPDRLGIFLYFNSVTMHEEAC